MATQRKLLKYGDLPQLSDSRKVSAPDGTIYYMTNDNPFLYCPVCRGEYSANRDDYFMVPDDQAVTCGNGHAPVPMRLVKCETRLIDVE